MNNNEVIEEMRIRTVAAEERARERIRVWFEQNDHPFARTKQLRRGEIWMLVIAVLCAGILFRSHASVMHALSSIHSALGV